MERIRHVADGARDRLRRNKREAMAGAAAAAGVAVIASLVACYCTSRPDSCTEHSAPVIKQALLHPLTGQRHWVAHQRFWRAYRSSKGRGSRTEVLVSEKPDTPYFTAVALGEPPQPLLVALDLGSANLWVSAHGCPACAAQGRERRQFNGLLSDTYRTSTYGAELSAGAGTCAGHLSQDTLRLGNLTVQRNIFLEAQSISSPPYEESQADGVLGLGLPQTAVPAGLETPLRAIARSHALKEEVFTLVPPAAHEQVGQLVFGSVPPGLYPHGINWVPVMKEGGGFGPWALSLDKVKMGRKVMAGRVGIVDPSASCMVLPAADAESFYRMSQRASARDARCSAQPVISLKIGGQVYQLKGEDYGTQLLGACELCVHANPDATVWVLGEVFQKKFPFVHNFNSDNPRVGLPRIATWRPWLALLGCGLVVLLVPCLLHTVRKGHHHISARWTARQPLRRRPPSLGATAIPRGGVVVGEGAREVPLSPRSVATDLEDSTASVQGTAETPLFGG